MPLSADTDYLQLPVRSTDPIAETTVEISLSRRADSPGVTWLPGEHTATGVRLLIGPDSDTGELGLGIWWAFVRFTTGLGDRKPYRLGGSFVVQGPPATEDILDGGSM